jgi:hypothetical protein
MEQGNYPSFKSWLFSEHELLEKTVGLVVLMAEVITLGQELYQGESTPEDKVPVTYIFNFLFLSFILYQLRRDFAKRFSVNANNPRIAELLRLSRVPDKKGDKNRIRILAFIAELLTFSRTSSKKNRKEESDKIRLLVFQANTFISQLQNINYFIAFTAGLYLVFIVQRIVYTKTQTDQYSAVFHLLTDLLSYIGAFYLLRCFFVMYLPTVDENGNDILNRRTIKYLFIVAFLMSIDFSTMATPRGRFVSEYICGVINSVVFILLIARFQNKILDVPPVILCFLYIYAILQTCLPIVTGEITGEILPSKMPSINVEHLTSIIPGIKLIAEGWNQSISTGFTKEFQSLFTNVILTLCLFGKVALSVVLLYVLNTKRIFYYFMTLKIIHEEEEKNWGEFYPLIDSFSVEPEPFSIIYDRNSDYTYTARIPGLVDGISGTGRTREEAKIQLENEIKGWRTTTNIDDASRNSTK